MRRPRGVAREFGEHPLQHPHRGVAMRFGHHMRGEPGLLEQLDELGRAVGPQRLVVDGAGQHLGWRVEVLGNGTGYPRQLALHRRVARDDRLARLAAEVTDLGQPDFRRARKGIHCGRGAATSSRSSYARYCGASRRCRREAIAVPTTTRTISTSIGGIR